MLMACYMFGLEEITREIQMPAHYLMFACNIPDSDASEYLTINIFNSGIDK